MQNENVEDMEKENDVTEEVETLFKTMTIKNLKKYESQIRTDIESKKQELRIMVGERYRDLIDAADSIMEMRTCAKEINENLIIFKIIEKKKLIYPIAAEIKLLVDTPEQIYEINKKFNNSIYGNNFLLKKIWNALENHKYLKAACLYMIAKLVYKHLQSSEEAKHLKIMVI
ncbi:hypothetical protein LY90DRAFT_500630 [Neocallimastix californiae]|uniref:Conserved oligomeric Golgi complex subunit 1 n=1 Tax=Neocallimastix californiae TaxID=1754190 RepID=A0A1Y2F7I9_9FUNG|nr:hypothetical protein LY90DRAFT_500630 [Neocallimastix californiae]|eukprot:ORY79617.1 hypothetical protein LY90DRAFT_500630 [Neocallimastix californiae]